MTVLHDGSARAEDDATPVWGPFRGTVVAPVIDVRGQGRKFHHLRNVPMVTDDARARELVKLYGKLVWSIVTESKYNVRHQLLCDRDDMFSIGCAIMIQSVEMFDASRGAKLSTWVAFRVRQGLMAVVHELHGTLREDGGRTARGEEIEHAKGAPRPKVFVESLDAPVRHEGREMDGTLMLDLIEDESDPVDERLRARQERDWILRTLETACSSIERDVVLRTLAGESGQSIGDLHGIARQRVDQIHQGAIEKLRRRRRIEDIQRERALKAIRA